MQVKPHTHTKPKSENLLIPSWMLFLFWWHQLEQNILNHSFPTVWLFHLEICHSIEAGHNFWFTLRKHFLTMYKRIVCATQTLQQSYKSFSWQSNDIWWSFFIWKFWRNLPSHHWILFSKWVPPSEWKFKQLNKYK